MSGRRKRRPPRAWIGVPAPVDPAELAGPRGLTPDVLSGGDDPLVELPPAADADPARVAFFESLLTPERRARIDSVVAARLQSVTVVCDRFLDPHNVAAVLRTSEGLGLLRAHVVPHEDGDLGAHRRVTQDADKWIDVVPWRSGAECARALAGRGFSVYAGHLDARAIPYTDLPADRPLALLFGNEHEGPSAETLGACAGTFRIPMAGFTQSFNVSVAAAVALAQVVRARRAALGAAGDLSAGQREALRARFVLLGAKLARRVKGPPAGRPPD